MEEDELRAKYAAGVRLSCGLKDSHFLRDDSDRRYRVFNRAPSEGQEDGKTAFSRSLRKS